MATDSLVPVSQSDALTYSVIHCHSGDNADIVVWNTLTGEKMQVISTVFHGPIGALVWVPQQPGMSLGFAFGCTNDSIHVYQFHQSLVCDWP